MTEANMNLAMLKNYLYVLVHIRDNWLCIDCSENILEQQVCQNVVFAEFTCRPTYHWKRILKIILYKWKVYIRVIIFFSSISQILYVWEEFFIIQIKQALNQISSLSLFFMPDNKTNKQTGFGTKIQTKKKNKK